MNKLKRRELRVLEAFCLAGVSCSSTEILRIIEGHGKKMLLRTFYAAVNGLMKKGMLVYADEKYYVGREYFEENFEKV